jgi:hypothetical protein
MAGSFNLRMGEGPPCQLPAGRCGRGRPCACPGTRRPAEGGGVQLNALTHGLRGSRLRVMVVSSVICPLLRQTKNPRPHLGREFSSNSRGSTQFSQRVLSSCSQVVKFLDHSTTRPFDHLTISCGCNGPSRSPYCVGNHTALGNHIGLPLQRFGFTLAGGFRRASAGPAHSRRPGLPEASTRLLVPVNTLMAYRLSRIARSSAYLR